MEQEFDEDLEMKYNLINFDWGDSYEFTGNPSNWELVDYYVDGIKQSDRKKEEMFEEIISRALHNIWEVVRFEGTRVTHQLCLEMEWNLQEYGVYPILFGEIRVKDWSGKSE